MPSDHNIRFYSFLSLISDLANSHNEMPETKRAFLHGFCDFFGGGEACSFGTSDSEVLEDDETPAPEGYKDETWPRPLAHGSGEEIDAYRAGWAYAAREDK